MSEQNKEYNRGADGFYREDITFDGKRYVVRAKELPDLYVKIDKKKKALENGDEVTNKNTSVKKWSEDWLKTYKKNAITEKSYKLYDQIIRLHITPAIGTIRLRNIKHIDLQKIMNNQAGKSQSHANKVRITLTQIFGKAFENRLISNNPSINLEYPQTISGTHRELTADERKAILSLAEVHPIGLWIKTILYTGIRPSETVPLKLSNIDFDNKVLHINEAMESGSDNIKAPKTKAGIRDIPIPDILFNDFLKIKGHKKQSDYLFLQQLSDKRLTQSSLTCYWRSFKRDLDIAMGAKVYRNEIIESKIAPDLVPYCLRHTYCTDLQDAGIPINIAKYLMGHTSIEVTSKIYTHHSEYISKKSLDMINEHLNSKIN